MRIVFLGTPDFAVPSLRMLLDRHYNIVGVFTQPDRPKGRGKKLTYSPVKEFALENELPVYQYEKIKNLDGVGKLKELSPDLMITAAFGQILSQEILDIPDLGCINVHGSLLPKYRGPAPIQWAIINGETKTGITTMYTDKGLDTGDIILKKEIDIGPEETAGELYTRMAQLGAITLYETLLQIEKGNITRIPQNSEEATYYPMLDKTIGNIDWKKSVNEICNLTRGVDPWPGAYTYLDKKLIKIWKVSNNHSDEQYREAIPGEILKASEKEGLIVMAANGSISVDEIQLPGGKRMLTRDYLRGNQLPLGEVFRRLGDE